ncbi:hypothetical protein Q3O59_08390 [Alkalimonas delamerensis]|uniref:ABC transporter substrate-binding protein n=1 Tax=Alkalimonas delamerensis TaxID=265981 RepID=A0ABT9GQ07_9GAMM|nr:hypothetical protein [Alkalimonas delamerensis]MDP4529047.1 hypothetical protein [Alkalimonas delamerensis]
MKDTLLIALTLLIFFTASALADERIRCGKSTLCSVENARPPFVLRNLPMPDGIQPSRLPVLLNTFSDEQIVDVAFTPETLVPLQLMTERWLAQHTDLAVLPPPPVSNQHYPGMKLSHDLATQRTHLVAWSASTAFTKAMTQPSQYQATDSLLLLFISRNTLLPHGSIPPYLTQGSWQERGEKARLGTEFFESLAYQAVLINHQGEVIAAATEGFRAGSSIYTDPLIFLTIGPDKYLRSWYQLNQRDIRDSITACEQDASCPAYQALTQLFANLQIAIQGAH